jgi:hypothetical protein
MNATVARARPRSLWIVGILTLLWNAYGAYDYLMQNTRNAAYLAHMPAQAIAWLDAMPYWQMAFWAIGVWGAVLGSVLLLLCSRFAVHAFVASLAGLAVNTAVGGMSAKSTGQPAGITVAIWVVAALLLLYAIRMRKVGALR